MANELVTSHQSRNHPIRRLIWPLLTGLTGLLLGYIIGASTPSAEEEEAEPVPASTPSTEETAANPPLMLTGSCGPGDAPQDISLFASVDATNTLNVGIEAAVWVNFSQIDAEPLHYVEIVEISAGEMVTVEFSDFITSEEWDKFEGSGLECEVGGEISGVLDDGQDD